MKPGIQNVLENAGKYACYYLCLCELAGAWFDSAAVQSCKDMGFLKEDFTVLNAGKIFSYLKGEKWTHTREAADYEPEPRELVIYEYYYDRSGLNHFRLKDWDSLANSQTVKLGKIRSTRVLRRVA